MLHVEDRTESAGIRDFQHGFFGASVKRSCDQGDAATPGRVQLRLGRVEEVVDFKQETARAGDNRIRSFDESEAIESTCQSTPQAVYCVTVAEIFDRGC